MDVVPEHDGHFPYRRDICSVLVHNYRWPTNSLNYMFTKKSFTFKKHFRTTKSNFLKRRQNLTANSRGKLPQQNASNIIFKYKKQNGGFMEHLLEGKSVTKFGEKRTGVAEIYSL